MRKRPVVVVFGLVLGVMFAGYLLLRSLMDLFENSELDWSSDLEEE